MRRPTPVRTAGERCSRVEPFHCNLYAAGYRESRRAVASAGMRKRLPLALCVIDSGR